MIIYKDVLGKLKDAGYSTYRIRQENLLPQSTVAKLKNNEPVNLTTLDSICKLTGLPVQELIEYKPSEE